MSAANKRVHDSADKLSEWAQSIQIPQHIMWPHPAIQKCPFSAADWQSAAISPQSAAGLSSPDAAASTRGSIGFGGAPISDVQSQSDRQW